MKLKCTNSNCKTFNEVIEVKVGQSTLQLHKALKCPVCGQRMEILSECRKEDSDKLSTIGTILIDSMTPMERKQLLKERSSRDFKKNIEAQKREMDRNVIPR